jgi:hypothetical protein
MSWPAVEMLMAGFLWLPQDEEACLDNYFGLPGRHICLQDDTTDLQCL